MSLKIKYPEYKLLSHGCLSNNNKNSLNIVNKTVKPTPGKQYQKRSDYGYNTIKTVIMFFEQQIEQNSMLQYLMYNRIFLETFKTKNVFKLIFHTVDTSLLEICLSKMPDDRWHPTTLKNLDFDIGNNHNLKEEYMTEDPVKTMFTIIVNILPILKYTEKLIVNLRISQEEERKKLKLLDRLFKVTHHMHMLTKETKWQGIIPTLIQE